MGTLIGIILCMWFGARYFARIMRDMSEPTLEERGLSADRALYKVDPDLAVELGYDRDEDLARQESEIIQVMNEATRAKYDAIRKEQERAEILRQGLLSEVLTGELPGVILDQTNPTAGADKCPNPASYLGSSQPGPRPNRPLSRSGSPSSKETTVANSTPLVTRTEG